MSLVITGASGQLGRRTAELLLETDGIDPADVVLISRSPDKLRGLAARGAAVRQGDFADAATLSRAFEGATRVLLVSTDAVGARVEHHQAAIEAANAAGAQLIAYTSIANPDPKQNPALVVPDHAATERGITGSGVPYTFLRNGLYSDYLIPEAQGALADGAFIYNTGDGATAYVSREDCAAAAAAVLAGGGEHAGKAYDITGPETLSGANLADLFASVSGTPVTALSVDDAAFVTRALDQGLPERVAELVTSIGTAIREQQLDQLTGDVEQLTGRKPVSVREMLEAGGVGQD
jgi:NAD(P)H dehydrogenase (quinone)